MDVKGVREQFRDRSGGTPEKVVLVAEFEQNSPVKEPHVIGDVAFIYLNDEEVGKITFSEAAGEPKKKRIRVDVTDKIKGSLDVVRFRTFVDRNLINEKFSSEALFRIRIDGELRVDEKYETKLPLRIVEDSWLLQGF